MTVTSPGTVIRVPSGNGSEPARTPAFRRVRWAENEALVSFSDQAATETPSKHRG